MSKHTIDISEEKIQQLQVQAARLRISVEPFLINTVVVPATPPTLHVITNWNPPRSQP